jgi:hypothetical protein
MATSYSRGHPIRWDEASSVWRYADTGDVVEHAKPRPCVKCGLLPTPEGHDACLGHIANAHAACCGHGVSEPYVIMNQRVSLEHYSTDLVAAMNEGRWQDATYLLIAKVDSLYRQIPRQDFAPGEPGVRRAPAPDHRCPEIGADTLQGAFLNGAKWWEWQSTGGTMWASDRDKAWAEAETRYPATAAMPEVAALRDRLRQRIVAAVERMPRYHDIFIHARDFTEDALLYALDEAVAVEPILKAEAALLEELAATRRGSAGAASTPGPEE